MKRFTSILTSIMVMFSIIACFPVNAEETDCINVKMSGWYDYDYAFEMLEILNKYREDAGLHPFIMEKSLLDKSMERAAELTIYYSHKRPNGESNGLGAETAAEFDKTPQQVVDAWMNSPAHHDILMEDYGSPEEYYYYYYIGAGCFHDAQGNSYWIFGSSPRAHGAIPVTHETYNGVKDVTLYIETLKSRITKWCFNIGKWYETSLNPIYSYDRKETPYSFSTDTYANSAPIDYENFTVTSSDESVVSVNEYNHTLYFNNAGTATITASFKEDPSIYYENTVTINPSVLPSAWELDNDVFYYDGKEQKPKVTYVGYDKLVEGKDFTVSYENNIGASDNIVEGKVILTGINGYIGKGEVTFLIYGSPCMRLSADEEIYYSHSFGSWAVKYDPTCTQNGKKTRNCSVCGKTEVQAIKATGHSFNETTIPPTCTEDGKLIKNCSVCGVTETEVIAKTGHSYTTKVVAPTCTVAGTKTFTCSCGDSYTESIPATGHRYGTKIIAPTCTEQGYTLHACFDCDDSYTETYISAKGHNFGDWVTKVFPGCTTNGSQTRKCTSCGASETQTIQRLGHTFSDWDVTKAPTCTDAGSQSRECSVCGKTETQVISKTGHSFGAWTTTGNYQTRKCSTCGKTETQAVTHVHSYSTKVVAPTCTAQGYTLHTCSKCNDSYKDNFTSAKGHSFSSWTTTKPATCTTDGTKTRKCSACGKTETATIAKTGHNYTTTVVAPTCTAQGYTLHTCSKCNDSYKDTYTNATGHSFGDWVTTSDSKTRKCSACGATETQTIAHVHSYTGKITSQPSCTVTGTKTFTCSCGDSYTESIPATGHSYTTKVVAPTCTAQGYTLHTCSKCNDSYKDTYTSAKGHSFGDWVIKVYPSCTTNGSQTRRCTSCGTSETQTIQRLGHTFSDWKITEAPTCTDAGSQSRECSICGKVETTTIPKTGHSYSTKVVAPTCTEQGYTLHTCSKCNYSYKDNYISTTGHRFGEWTTTGNSETRKCSVCGKTETQTVTHVHSYSTKVVAPTCTAQGYTLHTCSKCNDSYKDNFTDVKSHSFGDWVTKVFPGCTTNGSQTRRCTSCGAAETQTIQRLGHTFSDWKITKAPTCTDAGSQSRECSSCGKVETTTISKTGHSYTTKVVSPTCTAQGYTLHTCSKCSNSYKDTYTSAKGHSFSSWTTTKPATCTIDGTKERKCSACGKTETATIPNTGHSYTTKIVKPTHLAQGYTLHTCSNCGKSYKDTPTAKLTLANITKVTFTSAQTAVKMSWGKVSGATGYRVYQYNTTKKKWVGLANTTSTAYTFKSLKAGTTYKFTVRAYKTVSGKNVLSPKYSTFTTSTNPATVKFTLTAGLRKATVKWSKVTGATAYKVYYKTSKSGKWKCLKTTSNKATSYTKTGLTKGKTYYFTVKAVRTVGGKTYNGKYTTKSVKIK